MEDFSNVVMIANKNESSLDWHPREMLIDASLRAKDELPHVKKALVIFLDEDAEPQNKIKWHQAGLTRREMCDLLDMAKNSIMWDYLDGL